jgi:tetratricopeptide (TPR) repeat protein
MKILNWFILFIISNYVSGQQNLNPDVPLSSSFGIIEFIHIDGYNNQDTVEINIGEKIGTVAKYPKELSTKFDSEIKKSMKCYEVQDFNNARTILEKAILSEPNNPFILNAYARACYYIDPHASFLVYEKLISQLDSIYGNSDSKTVVDVWFREAYWKHGTLYMDRQEWQNAYNEISRFILSIQETKGQKIYIQALEFLTKCAFMTKDLELAKYLANRVLYYDPKNAYGKEILKNTIK